jgi:hypothetical protein
LLGAAPMLACLRLRASLATALLSTSLCAVGSLGCERGNGDAPAPEVVVAPPRRGAEDAAMPAPSTRGDDAGAPPAEATLDASAPDARPATWVVSARGQDQMTRLVLHAERYHSGMSVGRSFVFVWGYMTTSGYGELDDYADAPDMPSSYPRNFAEYMNQGDNAATWGLQRLPIALPHDAPPGAVVVVAGGSPGTSHPTAGDISVAVGNGTFINDGPDVTYGPRATFVADGGRVLGIYAPL